jgi:hypothetical protein
MLKKNDVTGERLIFIRETQYPEGVIRHFRFVGIPRLQMIEQIRPGRPHEFLWIADGGFPTTDFEEAARIIAVPPVLSPWQKRSLACLPFEPIRYDDAVIAIAGGIAYLETPARRIAELHLDQLQDCGKVAAFLSRKAAHDQVEAVRWIQRRDDRTTLPVLGMNAAELRREVNRLALGIDGDGPSESLRADMLAYLGYPPTYTGETYQGLGEPM